MRPIGIDLGTTYSAVATIGDDGRAEMIRNSDGQNTMPSVVLFESGEAIVGQQAKMQRAAFPDDVVEFVKRFMGNPTWRHYVGDEEYTPEKISAIILKRLAADACTAIGAPVLSVVITVPAYFDDAQRNATKQAGHIAGLDVIAVINEPTAAAISFGVETDFAGTLIVYDLGGGTFDVSILKASAGNFEVIRTDGDRNLGGFDFDNKIIEWAKTEFRARTGLDVEDSSASDAQLRERAEQAKHRLSAGEQAPFFVSAQGKSEKLILTREIFEEITASLLGRTEMLLEDAVEDANLSMSDIQKVLLVGGSTRMPMVAQMVERVTGQKPDQSVHPDEAVARGAAIAADVRASDRHGAPQMTKATNPVSISDVISHGLGVISLDEREIETNSVVVPSNSTVPCQLSRTFYTTTDNQTQIDVRVTEGDDTDLRYVRHLGNSLLTIPPHPAQSPVIVGFACDIDGILHIEVTDGTDNSRLGEFEIDRQSNLDPNEVSRMRSALANLEIQ